MKHNRHIDIDAGCNWDESYEFTDCAEDSTGVPGYIYVACKFPYMNHDTVLRVSTKRLVRASSDWVGITVPRRGKPQVVTPVPDDITDEVVKLAKEFIVLNRKLLRDHWFHRNDSVELGKGLQNVSLRLAL